MKDKDKKSSLVTQSVENQIPENYPGELDMNNGKAILISSFLKFSPLLFQLLLHMENTMSKKLEFLFLKSSNQLVLLSEFNYLELRLYILKVISQVF